MFSNKIVILNCSKENKKIWNDSIFTEVYFACIFLDRPSLLLLLYSFSSFLFFLLTENSLKAKLFLYPSILKIWIIPWNPDLFTSYKLNIFVKQIKSSLVGTLSTNHHSSSRPKNPFPFHHIPQLHVKHKVPQSHMNEHALFNKPLAVQLYKCLGQWSLTAWLSDNGPFKKTFF